jgi:hypothetical protein
MTLASPVTSVQRPDAPYDLTDEQADVWRQVVVALPADWFGPETWHLLEATGREVDARTKASLEVQMVTLRKKIAAAGYDNTAIRAIRNGGYQLLCLIEMK